MSKVPPPTQDVTASGYVIPHYDFDQQELYEGPPDVDEVLEEIKQQDVVEEFSAPVLSIQLVLSVPHHAKEHEASDTDIVKTASSQSSYLKQAFLEGSGNKKTVKFQHTSEEEFEDFDSENETEYSGESSVEGESGSETEEEKASGDDLAYPDDRKKILGKTFVSLSPNEHEVKMGIKQIISMFEGTIAKFVSMTREPRLSVFCRPPVFDLKLNFDEEEEEERLELIRPWPDLEYIFGDDPEYQSLLGELNTYVSMEMELVKQYSANFENFCVMVDKCLRLNIDESMQRRQWSTDEFSTVLALHTDMGASKKLDHYPKSVEEFVEHLSFLGKMSSELPALEREFEIVNKLFTIAKDYNVKVTDEQLALYQTLGPDFITLKVLPVITLELNSP
ncbi:dynein axonemal heavy chain 14-like [Mercenaria mercenaria]|uniref:dynein axonemal heavy chain 14-like n=1 Tax=Mercenaria mercenaria TaxID=6596 RepID=UPI00234F4025|nr:dynein axonemal heavy chain 14-like [Mercenaria mercenaria]